MNKTRKKRNARATRQSRENQAKFKFQGIKFWEVESWTPRQIRKGLDGLFDEDLSWTQLAIARAGELS